MRRARSVLHVLIAALALAVVAAGCGAASVRAPAAQTVGGGAGPEAQVNRGAPGGAAAPLGPTGLAAGAPRGGEGFGLTKQQAVEVCMPGGEREYLASLRCPDGSVPEFARRGNVGERNPGSSSEADLMMMMDPNAVLPPGVVDSHIVDLYDVRCADGTTVEVYMDMYHCADPDPLQPVGPLSPGTTSLPVEVPPGAI